MATDTTLMPDVESLRHGHLDLTADERDWSEGYGETWDYIEVPTCPVCGDDSDVRYISGDDLADSMLVVFDKLTTETVARLKDTTDRDELTGKLESVRDETWQEWRCTDPNCENIGVTIDPHEGYSEGPMMNYSYAIDGFPLHEDAHAAASALAGLPLCIVSFHDGEGYALALTGGGMDLSWEICEAFMRLGYLPPLVYADLPGMAGRPRGERDEWIIAGATRAFKERLERAQRDYDYAMTKINNMRAHEAKRREERGN